MEQGWCGNWHSGTRKRAMWSFFVLKKKLFEQNFKEFALMIRNQYNLKNKIKKGKYYKKNTCKINLNIAL